ncbi:MAG: hypothetical protein ABGY75_08970 [Gemmataceae bacterium]
MTTRLLRLHTPTVPAPPPPRSDLGYSTLTFFARLRDALRSTARSLHADRSGVPRLFFFDRDAQRELAAEQSHQMIDPRAADLIADALTLLPASVEVRRAARATDGLRGAIAAVAKVHKPARELVELLDVPDDQVVLAIHPEARVGVRVLIRGVADVHQLHVLLADLLPGRRVDSRILDAYLDADPDPDAAVMAARFQMFRPTALRPDGTLPRGFAGSDHWVWGEQSPAALPLESGERVVLLGEPAFAAEWDVGRKFPRLNAEVERVEALGRAEVERWLAARCPAFRANVPVRQAA